MQGSEVIILDVVHQAHRIKDTTYDIRTDKAVGKLKVAALSDSHTGTTFHREGFAKHMKDLQNMVYIMFLEIMTKAIIRRNTGISDWAIKFKTGCKSEYLIINIDGQI